MQQFIALKFKAVLVCLNAKYFTETYAGREIDADFLNNLPAGIDPCGENGEYHSFVYDGPIFKNSISFTLGETVLRTYGTTNNQLNKESDGPKYDNSFWFIDLK